MKKLASIVIFFLGFSALYFIDQSQLAHWRSEKTIELDAALHLYQTRLDSTITSRLNAIESLAALFALHPKTSAIEFSHFAAFLLQLNPPIRAIQYADSDTRVIYVYPPTGNEITINKPMTLLTDPERAPFVKKAIQEKRSILQGPFELRQGGAGVVVRFPIFKEDDFIGLSIGVYDMPVLANEALKGLNYNQFAFHLKDPQGNIFWSSGNISDDSLNKKLSVAGSTWTIVANWLIPSTPPMFSRALIWFFGLGFLLAILFSFQIAWKHEQRLKKQVEERTIDLSNSNNSLLIEIAERKQAELQAKERVKELQAFFTLSELITREAITIEELCHEFCKSLPKSWQYPEIACARIVFGDKEFRTENFDESPWLQSAPIKVCGSVDGRIEVCYFEERPEEDDGPFLKEERMLINELAERLGRIVEGERVKAEKIKLESQLQQAQKMESIGTLAGGIAHDFNNILFPIVGYTQMLLEDTPEDSPTRVSLNQIYTSALRAKSLVKQILTFSRQESSELMLMKMQPIVKEALKLIRSTIPTTIEIIQDIHPDCGVIKADPTQIHQIIMNLATNAYHAMEETGGEIKVRLKEIELGEYDILRPDMNPGIYACLTIADTGRGMDKELTQKIFDPFFTTKEKGKGTGMGLSVVHGIVTNMNGAIQVYSEPGEGTQLHVYLPVEKNFSEEQVIHSKIEIQGGTEQILLVDDEEAILSMEKRMLERLGYQVTSRTSSIEALEVFRDSPDKFDIVITDKQMPNMPGDKLSAELIKIRPDIPVLLCTGFSEKMSEERAASLGIKGFLWKPIVMKDLAQKIREVLDNKIKEVIEK